MSVDTLQVGPLTLPRPALMGIVNVTPDSFSDGGRFADVAGAVAAAKAMVAQGADLIDIGGESTRPHAAKISVEQELSRVLPVVKALRAKSAIPISVDTSSPQVMSAVIDAGASMINDVRALSRPGALEVLAGSDVAICLMHMRGTPQNMQKHPTYADVVRQVMDYLQQAIDRCLAAGIDQQRLILDPGIGFGKSLQHNLTLLGRLSALKSLGCPLLVGVSRKSMFQELLGRAVDERLAGTLAAGQLALNGGADILRVHDVAPHADLREVWRAVGAVQG